MEREEEQPNNWSETVEDLVAAGDTDTAISLLESVVSKLETLDSSKLDLQLASVLIELANLYSSNGFSLKADETRSRASLLKLRTDCIPPSSNVGRIANKDLKDSVGDGSANQGHFEKSAKPPNDASPCDRSSDDDWEAIADHAPDELLPSEYLPAVLELSLEDTKVQVPKRRGRGTFSYKKDKLYSDKQSGKSISDETEDEGVLNNSEGNTEVRHSRYGTHHVLVLADFPPSTRTTELEKLFEDFRDHGVVIRWVNDTAALAVFRTPSIALEARNCIQYPFTVRILDKDDILLSSISTKDLEPPRQRPQTSARTAQRLIAQGMGLKLPSTAFGSQELKKQEEARRNRIVSRQKLRDDAWGDDDVK